MGGEGETHARETIDLLSAWGIPFTPRNYEVGIAHILGDNENLSNDIDVILNSGCSPSESEIGALYDRYFSNRDLSEEVAKVGGAMSAELATVVQRLEEAGRNTAAYGEALAGASDKMHPDTDAVTLQTMVSALMEATDTMQRHSTALEQRLADTREEVTQLRSNLEVVREESLTDALTGIANRKHMDDALTRLVAHADQTGEPLSVAVYDIDHFKKFNDTWGHQTGDQIIRYVASCMTQCAGDHDLVARYGGEEFVMLLPDSNPETAFEIADKVRCMVESKRLLRRSTSEDLGNITISVGVAQHNAGDAAAAVIELADNRLYESKRAGRNRVTGEDGPSTSSQAA